MQVLISNFIGINVDPIFMDLPGDFLHYSWYPVGDNHVLRSLESHSLVLFLDGQLFLWRHMYASLEGRGGGLNFLNFVFNAISIFFLYYMKMVAKIYEVALMDT